MKSLYQEAKAIQDQIVADRRYLHQIPEVGMDLPESAAYIEKRLSEMGIPSHRCGVMPDEIRKKYVAMGFPDMAASTGVVATIGSGSPCILLRADFDALPKDHESELKGTVKLMFQPGEEMGYGSKTMIDDGLLENPKVDAAFALHIFSTTPVGEVTYCTGVTSSSLDSFIVNIQGKGGHSSTPQLSIDPLMIANQIYTAANMLMTREVDPKATATLSAGVLRSGTAVNILPDTATLQMGMRTYDKEARAHILERLPQIIDHYVKAWRGDYELVTFNCPCTYTDDTVSHELLPAIAEIVGEENISNTGPMAGTEDFSYVAEAVPSMFICLGEAVPSMFICLGAGGPDQYPHHNPRMVLDESVFFQGAAIHANCAMEWLNRHGK